MSKKCLGCGVKLQDIDKNVIGYTKSLEMDYCMRCFRIMHYHDLDFQKTDINGDAIIKTLYGKKGFAFFFVDFLNIGKESMNYYHKIEMPKCLVISKSDTIPKSIYLPRINEWLKNTFDVQEPILFLQKNSKTSMKKIMQIIENEDLKSVYMVGMTNAGKSTFLNEWLRFTNSNKKALTVSEKPNTTLDFVRISFEWGTLYDTAGIPYSYYESDDAFLNIANVKKEIKPKTFPMKENMSLIIEQRIRFEILSESSVTFFGSDDLHFTKVYDQNTRLKNEKCLTLDVFDNAQVLIKGLGFFYVKKASTIKLYGVEKDVVEVFSSFMGAHHE